jgi:adenylate cyclase
VAVTPDQVRGQLDRLLASEVFAGSARLSRFLRYVVERTLAGEGDRLKEYAIGVDVFDRDDGYDPRLDSLVRVEAGRLRTKLSEYYAGAGVADPVVIRMPRGGYAPVFEERAIPPGVVAETGAPDARAAISHRRRATVGLAAAALLAVGLGAWRLGLVPRSQDPPRPLVIAVLPFAHHSSSPSDETLAARLTDGVTAELARTGALGVVSHTSALQFSGARKPLREIAQALGADVVLEATLLREGERVRVQARLIDGARDRKVWVEDFVGNPADLRELQQRIAASVASAAPKRLRR